MTAHLPSPITSTLTRQPIAWQQAEQGRQLSFRQADIGITSKYVACLKRATHSGPNLAHHVVHRV